MKTRYRLNKELKKIIITLGIVFLFGIVLASVVKDEKLKDRENTSRIINLNLQRS